MDEEYANFFTGQGRNRPAQTAFTACECRFLDRK